MSQQQQQQHQVGADDEQSIGTGMSAISFNSGNTNHTSTSKRSIFGDALLILRGINPNDVIHEEEGDTDVYKDDRQNEDDGEGARMLQPISEGKSSYETGEEDVILGTSVVLSKSGSRSYHSASNGSPNNTVRWKEEDEKIDNGIISASSERSIQFIDFLQDDVRTMTYGRRIALFLMKKYAWYNPRLKSKKVVGDNDTTQEGGEEEELIEPMHPLLAASIEHDMKRSKKASMKRINNCVSYRDLIIAASASKSNDEDEQDMLLGNYSRLNIENTPSNMSTERLLLDGQYPFTHSRRENPTLEKAWAYFDHVALSRYVIPPNAKPADAPKKWMMTRIVRKVFCKAKKKLERAEPGERIYPTALYDPIFTPHNQLGDFGLGIGLYFSTLRAITVITLFATILNIPNFFYYSSTDYTPGISNFNSTNVLKPVPTLLQGSAICNDVSWVICPECNTTTGGTTSTNKYFPRNRRADAYNLNTNETIRDMLFLRNNCATPKIQTSMINYATMLLIMVGTVVLNIYLRRMEVAFDEDEQTAQDYSIVISNPPGDATDPQEWHTFFYDAFDGAHVTACTVAVDNDLLVRSLVERREILRRIEMILEPGTSLDTLTLAGIAAKQEKERKFFGHVVAIVVPGIPELFARLTVLTAKVQGLAQQDYPATNVFVTFETERAQRQVLSAYNFGSIDIRRNSISKISDPKHLFRGQYILNVKEPDEPNTIRWQDLNVTAKAKLKQQLMTILATLAAIILIAYLVYLLNNNDKSLQYTAFAIAICNSIFPSMCINFERGKM
jgi:hypothetical protein